MSRDEVDPVAGQDDVSDEQSRDPVATGDTAEEGGTVLVVVAGEEVVVERRPIGLGESQLERSGHQRVLTQSRTFSIFCRGV